MNERKRVLLGFSGGADSCRAAEKLSAQGYAITALMLVTHGDGSIAENAEEKAVRLGVDFRALDVRGQFESDVVGYFVSEYMRGRTPAPCTVCNRLIKWRILYEAALEGGFDHIATGHYFSLAEKSGRLFVSRPADRHKDQSWYLWQLGQDVLEMALTPMADEIKSERTLAKGYRESMGVCFLEGESPAAFLRSRCGERITPGDIIDRDGRIVGRHEGFPYYTIGQKRGLGLPPGWCVTAIDPDRNLLVAGAGEQLYYRNLVVSGIAAPDMEELLTAGNIAVMIRGIGVNPEGHCSIRAAGNSLVVELDDPAWAPAAGQPVVFYRGDRVVGGGFLERYY